MVFRALTGNWICKKDLDEGRGRIWKLRNKNGNEINKDRVFWLFGERVKLARRLERSTSKTIPESLQSVKLDLKDSKSERVIKYGIGKVIIYWKFKVQQVRDNHKVNIFKWVLSQSFWLKSCIIYYKRKSLKCF